MKEEFYKHIIPVNASVKEALEKLNQLPFEAVLFVVDEGLRVLGTVTDGDLRRGLIKGLTLNNSLKEFMNFPFSYFKKEETTFLDLTKFRKLNIKILPELDEQGHLIGIINLDKQKSFLPVDAVIMAGGRGERLRPLTDHLPKPLLLVGNKPIIEHNIDRLSDFGIKNFWITINYLGEKIESYFKTGLEKNIQINYIKEPRFLGTIGSVSLINNLRQDTVLIMNSDLLTSIDFEEFYQHFLNSSATMAVASIPYKINIPYAVLEVNHGQITTFKEKPTYTFQSNAGIYLIKKSALSLIPKDTNFNATDLIGKLIELGHKVVHFPILNYWIDIGRHEDYKKAQEDIEHLNL